MGDKLSFYKDVLCEEIDEGLEKAIEEQSTVVCLRYQPNMTEVPETVKLLRPFVEELYLDNNYCLQRTGPHLGELSTLRLLDLSYGRLFSVHPTIGKLNRLVKLYLSNNQLNCLPMELRQLRKLQTLRLDNNQFRVLPEWILFLPELTEIELENNPFFTEEDVKQVSPQVVVEDIRKHYAAIEGSGGEAAASTLFATVGCASCWIRTAQYTPLLSAHTILSYPQVPFLHFVCSEECRRNHVNRLTEYDERQGK